MKAAKSRTNRSHRSKFWIVRVARGHVRILIASVLGAGVYAAIPGEWSTAVRILVSWNTGVILYLVATAVMMARAPVTDIKRHANERDEGGVAVLALSVLAAAASLGAIIALMAASNRAAQGVLPYALGIATVVLSWMFIHTMFALHYAYEFYGHGERAKGLEFPDEEPPDYWEFIYFAFVIGSTFQVSDVQITDKVIRRWVTIHGMLSFFFSTTVVAIAVNMAANAG